MKKKETSNTEAAAILVTITGCLTQLAPIMDAHRVGSMIMTVIVAIAGICWVIKKRE